MGILDGGLDRVVRWCRAHQSGCTDGKAREDNTDEETGKPALRNLFVRKKAHRDLHRIRILRFSPLPDHRVFTYRIARTTANPIRDARNIPLAQSCYEHMLKTMPQPTILLIWNRPPYDATDVAWNALRLAGKLLVRSCRMGGGQRPRADFLK